MYKRVVLAAAAAAVVAALAACDPEGTPDGASYNIPSPSVSVPYEPTDLDPDIRDEAGATAYVREFRSQFPDYVQGRTDAQIASDGEADCADMAQNMEITTPAMAERYNLSGSLADQFTLHNIALLATFTICPTQ